MVICIDDWRVEMKKLVRDRQKLPRGIIKESVSFVVPVYNEALSLSDFYREFKLFLNQNQFLDSEIVFVNDGSTDHSLEILQRISAIDANVKVVNLARNFGKEIALTAGIDYTSGIAVIPIDADFQHPFHVINQFIDNWRLGFDVVYAVQIDRKQSKLRKTCSQLFHRLISKLGGKFETQENAGDFRLLTRRAVNKLKRMRERHRIMKGLYSTVGLKQKAVYYKANERRAGKSKWSFLQLINLAIEGITSHSTAPLRLATIFGAACAAASVLYALLTIVKTILFGDPVAGYPTLITVILFLGSIQLVCLGIIGEYLGRVFNETKNRPLYFIEDVYELGEATGQWEENDARAA